MIQLLSFLSDQALTPDDLADVVGYRREYVRGICRGERPITPEFIRHFATIYGFEAEQKVFGAQTEEVKGNN